MQSNARKSYRAFNNHWEALMKDCFKEATEENIYVDDALTKYKDRGLPEIFIVLFFYGYFFISMILLAALNAFFLFFPFIFLFVFLVHFINSKSEKYIKGVNYEGKI